MLFALATALALAPATAEPSIVAAQALFTARLRRSAQGAPLRIVSFRKTNGQARRMGGISYYRFFYSATVTFPNGFHAECLRRSIGPAGWRCMDFMAPGYRGPRPVERGGTTTFNGAVEFQLTQRGWIPA